MWATDLENLSVSAISTIGCQKASSDLDSLHTVAMHASVEQTAEQSS